MNAVENLGGTGAARPTEQGGPTPSGVRGLTVEEIQKLLEKAEPAETKYLLFLTTQTRPGESFSEREDYAVVFGEVEEVELERYYNYPTDNRTRYMLVPKVVPTVVRWWRIWDFGPQDCGEEETIYVFTADGWKKVPVTD
jgi:hypothetical protein